MTRTNRNKCEKSKTKVQKPKGYDCICGENRRTLRDYDIHLNICKEAKEVEIEMVDEIVTELVEEVEIEMVDEVEIVLQVQEGP
ncbi:hypothetical protein ACHQM5_011489 [Ranunculus cassubicifolius]